MLLINISSGALNEVLQVFLRASVDKMFLKPKQVAIAIFWISHT